MLRLIDTGLADAQANMELSRALAKDRRTDAVPDTLRFFRFRPCVLVGCHQIIEAEVDLAAAQGLDIVRRPTGGGAVYIDEGQLCWELALRRDWALPDAAKRICTAVARGLSRLGIDARFLPGNDIEAGGAKLGGTAGLVDGSVLLYHGTVLVDTDCARMAAVLTPPADKLARHGVRSVAARVTTLKALLGTAPPLEMVKAAIVAGIEEGL
jgi:lipoate-protein ligase A